MYSLSVIVDTDVLEAYQSHLTKLPTLLKTAFDRDSRRIRQQLRTALHTEPSQIPDLPFIWSNDPAAQARARRYYFGVILRGKKRKGGRYERTHALVNAWKVTYTPLDKGGVVSVSNDAKGFEYVIGNRQVRSHSDTGWYVTDNVLIQYSEKLTNTLIESWHTVTDPYSGVY